MLAAFLLLFVQVPTVTPPAQAAAAEQIAPDALDVSLSVRASAQQVRWRQVGTILLRAWSEPGGHTVEQSLSTGLPRPIPGQRTFNDVGWSLDVGAALAAPNAAAVTPSATSQTSTPSTDPQ